MDSAETVPALDLRISIEDTEPLIWRRLLVPESLTLEQFHLVVQAAFGWENRHLYGIQTTDRTGRKRTITDTDDGQDGFRAGAPSGVVLSELLDPAKPGTAFDYDYDFGDNWTHHVELVGSGKLNPAELRFVDGANRGPVEDSGGPFGYRQLVEALADEHHPEHSEARSWTFQVTGKFGPFDPTGLDPEAISRRLRMLSLQWWPQPLTDQDRSMVLGPILWFLHAASGDGLELTKDGYLKPAVVRQALEELGWDSRIVGKGNRENQTPPILELRQHMLDWKLLQKRKGRLLLAPRGRHYIGRPAELWDYMVETIALPEHPAVYLTTRLYAEWLVSGIAPPLTERVDVIRSELEAAGMVTRSGHPIPAEWAIDIDRTVRWNLKCLQLMGPKKNSFNRALVTDGGLKFVLQARELAGQHVPEGLLLPR